MACISCPPPTSPPPLLQLLFPNDSVVFEKITDTIDAGDEGARKRRIPHGAQQPGIRAHVFR